MQHVIWDWNGTLLNDVHLMAEATSQSSQTLGGPAVDIDTYRREHRRPLDGFYERIVGRSLTSAELDVIDHTFHTTYLESVHGAELAIDAIASLGRVAEAGMTQSLLSMWKHNQLVPLIDELGLAKHFVRVDGQMAASTGTKVESMTAHIQALESELGISAGDITVIGDTDDDGKAATATGVSAILVTTGAQHPNELHATGWPVHDTLTDALTQLGI